jgi:flagellar protein FlaJ
MFKYFHEVAFLIIGSVVLLANFLFVAAAWPILFPILNVIGGMIALLPPSYIFYKRYKMQKEVEEQFIVFIRDLTDSVDSGMTLPLALDQCAKKDYFSLTPYVKDLSAQVNWGIPFKKALTTFAKKTKSKTITRAIKTVIEAYKVGGKISETLTAISTSLVTIDKIKKERTASVRGQIATTYLIFFVFIFILVVLQIFLIPTLTPKTEIPGVEITGLGGGGISPQVFTRTFEMFIVIQGFFSGLVTGKMAEGSIMAGIKHSILFITIGYSIFSLAIQLPIQLF